MALAPQEERASEMLADISTQGGVVGHLSGGSLVLDHVDPCPMSTQHVFVWTRMCIWNNGLILFS